MMPWIVLVLVSRKVKGMPVGVEPTVQHLLRRSRHHRCNRERRDRGQTKTLHRIPLWAWPMSALAHVVIRRCGPSRFGLFSPI
ncbi:hypothetical protein ABIF97_004580 [Bradyrhizobium japonicum]